MVFDWETLGSKRVSLAFLEVPLLSVQETFVAWKKSLGWEPEVEPICLPLREAARLLPPTAIPPSRYLWLKTASSWVAQFSNSVTLDPHSPTTYLCRRMSCRGLALQYAPFGGPGDRRRMGFAGFTLYGPGTGNWDSIIRAIQVSSEGEEAFSVSGQVQDFEDVGKYELSNVRERLTLEMLREYAGAMGLRPFEDEFYGPEGILIRG